MKNLPDRFDQTVDRFIGKKILQIDPKLRFKSEKLSMAYDVWQKVKGAREFPKKEDLVPFGFPQSVLPHVLLQEIEHSPELRCRWRLIGTHVTEALGRDSSGKYWDQIYPESVLARQLETTHLILEERKPLRTVVTSPIEEQFYLTSENLDLPVSQNGSTIDMIVIVADFTGSNFKPKH